MLLSTEEKRVVLSVLLPKQYKIIVAAHAKLYHASYGAFDWDYTGTQGVVVFGRNRSSRGKQHDDDDDDDDERYWFQMIDISRKKIIWRHRLPRLFDYKIEAPFWHTFGGTSRMFGLRFEDDDEGTTFFQEVSSRIYPNDSQNIMIAQTRRRRRVRRLTAKDISAPLPGTFEHVAHVGADGNGFTSMTVEPDLHNGLRKLGVSEKMIEKNRDFIQGFLAGFARRQTCDSEAVEAEHHTEKHYRRKPIPADLLRL